MFLTQWLDAWPAITSRRRPATSPPRPDAASAERRAVVGGRDLRRQHRVVLGERAAALDLDRRLRVARVGVEQPRLLDHADQRVPATAEQAVRRPQVELVAAAPLELLAVVEHLAPQPGVVAAGDPGGELGPRPHLAALDVGRGHVRCAVSGSPSRPIQNDGEKIWYGRWVSSVETVTVTRPRLR